MSTSSESSAAVSPVGGAAAPRSQGEAPPGPDGALAAGGRGALGRILRWLRETDAGSDEDRARATRGRFLAEARWLAALAMALVGLLGAALGFLDSAWPALAVAGAVAAYNFVLERALPAPGGSVLTASMAADIVALTAFLHFSGDMENPLTFAYSLPVAAGAVLVSRRAAFLLAAVATGSFTALVLLTLFEYLPHHHLRLVESFRLLQFVDPDLDDQAWNYLLAHLLGLSGILFGTAAGLGTLAGRLGEKEDELRAQYQRLELLIDVLPQGVLLIEADGSVLVANPAARRILGDVEAGAGTALDRLGIRPRLADLRGPTEELETRVEGRVLAHALARAGSTGPIVWVIQDLTDQRRIMAQMIHGAKMADLGLLAAGIAHEIGNPLSSMSALLERLERRTEAPESRERIQALHGHVERIHRIVRTVTDFSRTSADARSPASPDALIEQALGVFRLHERGRDVRAIFAEPDGPGAEESVAGEAGTVHVVGDQIVQVLLNLLLNAADASPEGEIEVSARPAGEHVAIAVSDRGPGMPPEVVQHLFTPFFTTKEPGRGVGLGLFVSESILRAHGGWIDVRSTPGEGTTFTVFLPRAEARDGSHPGRG